MKLLPEYDEFGYVKRFHVLTLQDQFARADDKSEFINGLEIVMTQNQLEQLRREVELDLPRDQAQQDDFYYVRKRNAVLAAMDVLGANPYITGNSHPFRKLCISDDHFRTVNPNWDAFAAHRTGRKLRSAWKNAIPWQDERKEEPAWGIWKPLRTLIAETNLHEGPVHDAMLVTPTGMSKMRAEMPFSTNIKKVRDRERNETVATTNRWTAYGQLPQQKAIGEYKVENMTLKLMAASGIQGMTFLLEHDVIVNDEPVDIIVSPRMIQKKSAWTVLLNNNIPLDKVQEHLVEFELERRTAPAGWKVDERLLVQKGVGLVVTEYWATTSHNEVYFARDDQTLTIRPEQHFCAGLPFDPLEMIDLREVNDYWNMAKVLIQYYE
ncbi:MAG: hypothetical protein KatS3mg023_3849 [Armatimonadota bacterium]|nr:MAG: hypothetical protein KatS3mg023_2251 [Armatimonadota bacterium]GIV22098.1 MAG: hypothetical protein KatS3mg023_3849 [Armatimonadota bacterium]